MSIARSGATRPAGPGARSHGESGNVMIVALLVLVVLTTAGVTFIAVTKSEKQIASNTMTATQALYAAEAGITEGLHRMSFPAESTNYIGPSGAPYPGWGAYIVIAPNRSALDPDRASLGTDGLDNNGDGTIDEPGEQYPEILTKQTVNANALRYPYVRVEYKTQGGQLVRFGDADNNPVTPPTENLTKGAPVLRITARGRNGDADKTLEAEAVRFPLVEVEGAIWTGGHVKLNGNAFFIDGHDHSASAPYDTIPGANATKAILTKAPAAEVSMKPGQLDNVSGAGGDASVAQSTYTYDFNAMWAQLCGMSDYKFTGDNSFTSTTPNYGTLSDPKVITVDGSLDCGGNWSGAGILIVNGSLAMGGNSQFKGIVIAMGDVFIAGGGAGDQAHIIGGLIYQSTVVDASSVGGAASVYYSSEAVNAAMTLNRYTLSWWRER